MNKDILNISSEECKRCKNPSCSGKKLNEIGFKIIKCPYGGAVDVKIKRLKQ